LIVSPSASSVGAQGRGVREAHAVSSRQLLDADDVVAVAVREARA
jgi:hypothetical protein